jgi:TetR/AcrR family acrAB operon transcriptional repressor
VTRGAVYWHFRDKADLCAAMCERALLPMEIMLSDAGAATHDDPLGTLRTLAITALTRLACDPRSQAVFEVMLHETDSAGEMAPLTERRQRERRHCLTHVERVLQQAVSGGQLPGDTDTPLAAQALHAYIGGLMNSWVLDPAAHDLACSAPALVDTFFAGLRAAPPRVAVQRKPTRRRAVARRAPVDRQGIIASSGHESGDNNAGDRAGRRHRRRNDGQRHRAGVRHCRY